MRAAVLALVLAAASASAEPNPPTWPQSVTIFSPEDAAGDIEAKVNAAYATNGGHAPANHGQFSSERFAFLFKPGQCASAIRYVRQNALTNS